MKKVWVPRLAVYAKYVSRAGERNLSCIRASHGVSQRTMGMRRLRRALRQVGSLRASVQRIAHISMPSLATSGGGRSRGTHSGRDACCPHPVSAPWAGAPSCAWR